MFSFILFIFASVICGLYLSYKFKLDLYFSEKILFGFVIALASFTHIAYLISYFGGGLKLIPNAITITLVSLVTAYSIFKLYKMKGHLKEDFNQAKSKLKSKSEWLLFGVLIFWFCIFTVLFIRNIFVLPEGLYSSTSTDVPVHYSFITSFVWGENFPPKTPLFAGEKLVYPFLSDYLSAFFISNGMNAINALNYMGILMCSILTGIMYFFSLRITNSKNLSILSIFLLYLGGSLGFWKFFEKELPSKGYNFIKAFYESPDLYTDLVDSNFQLYNFILAYLLPQRSFLFGFPMALIILTILWKSIKDFKENKTDNIKNQLLIVGFTTGILPLFHYHSFMCVAIIASLWFLLFIQKKKEYFTNSLYFLIPMIVLSIPQLLMAKGGLQGNTETFKIHFGWMANDNNYVWFWIKNTGFMFFLILESMLSKSTNKDLKKMYIPFAVLFLLANIISFSPCWIGDNAKVIFFWFIGSMPFIAISLANLYKNSKVIAITILLTLTLSGTIDVSRYLFTPIRIFRIWSSDAVTMAKEIIQKTDPKAVFLTAPVHYSPIYLTGRPVLAGEHTHVCTQGIDLFSRESDIKQIYQSVDDIEKLKLIDKLKPDYALIGPPELNLMFDKTFFERHFKVFIKVGEETLYKIK